MATVQSAAKLLANNALKLYDFDPGATTATDIGWLDMRDYENFAAAFCRTIGTGATTFAIIANAASDGSGTDVTVVSHAVGSEPDAVGDQLWLECTAQQIRDAGERAGHAVRYVSASVSVATATDEGVVLQWRGGAKAAASGLTADVVA